MGEGPRRGESNGVHWGAPSKLFPIFEFANKVEKQSPPPP